MVEMDLLDLAEEPEPIQTGPRVLKYAKYPTFCIEPHLSRRLHRALDERNWRACRALGAVWYDEYAERWFQVGPHFWDIMEYREYTIEA